MNYLTLTSIPLFTGISGDDLALIMGRIDLIDIDLAPGEVFVRRGDVCQCMAILREGTILRTNHHDYGTFHNSRRQEVPLSYEACEEIQGQMILEPEVLFGLNLRHQNTWTAKTPCHLTLIGKEDIRKTLMYVPVWRINFINMLCTEMQRAAQDRLPHSTPSTQEMVRDYILRHCTQKGQSITLSITLEQLANQLGISRKLAAETIGAMEKKSLIVRARNTLQVPSLSRLRAQAES